MKRVFALASIVALVSVVGKPVSSQSAQSDPRIGTWKLNTAKSQGNTRKSETRTYTQSGDGVTGHIEIVNSDGSTQVYGMTNRPDGKDYPYTGQVPGGADTIAVKRVGNNTFTAENKKGGKVLSTTRITFSADGSVMTMTTKGVDADGKPIISVRVYDKQ